VIQSRARDTVTPLKRGCHVTLSRSAPPATVTVASRDMSRRSWERWRRCHGANGRGGGQKTSVCVPEDDNEDAAELLVSEMKAATDGSVDRGKKSNVTAGLVNDR